MGYLIKSLEEKVKFRCLNKYLEFQFSFDLFLFFKFLGGRRQIRKYLEDRIENVCLLNCCLEEIIV